MFQYEYIEECFLEEEEYEELSTKYLIIPNWVFDGGAIFEDEDEKNLWLVFDKEPTITIKEFEEFCKEAGFLYLSNEYNSEDYRTWVFWENQEDAEWNEEDDW